MKNNGTKTVEIYVELLDEGTETWRPTLAEDMGNGLFKLLPTPDYDPEDEAWAFLPGEMVAAESAQFADRRSALAAKHPDPNVIRIHVPLLGEDAPAIRPTKAMDLGNGLYKILPTPHYRISGEKWKFLPGAIVRLEEMKAPNDAFTYLVASDRRE